MRVLYLDQSGQLGGGEIALLPWLSAKRENALVLLFEDGPFRERLEQEGIPALVVPMLDLKQVRRESGWKSTLSSLPMLMRVYSELRPISRDFDVLYANSMKALILAALIRRRRQPVVWHLRDILSAEHFSAPLRLAVVLIANCCASAVIANSKATAKAFIIAGGIRKKITVVYDGVCSTAFSRPVEVLMPPFPEVRVPRERMLLGVFSRLSPWKGQHIVLDAISTLPNVDLLVVGDSLFGEADYAASLLRRAAGPDLAGRVKFLGFQEDVAELMRSVDIVIHSSTAAEPFGLVIVEGMLVGKAVIATNAGGASEIIEAEKSGILVAPGSVIEMREAILRLSTDRSLMTSLAEAGRTRAAEQFPIKAMLKGIGQVLRRFDKGRPEALSQKHIEASGSTASRRV